MHDFTVLKTKMILQKKRLLVIIVNYKTSIMVCDAIQNILPQLNDELDHITIVDNNSSDNSLPYITNFIQSNHLHNVVNLVASDINGGFSYGNNLAINNMLNESGELPEYIFLLNPDTIVRQGAVSSLLDFMKTNLDVGIAGSRLEGEDKSIQFSSFRFPSLISELDSSLRLGLISRVLSRWSIVAPLSDVPSYTDWLAGASMMIRREVFTDIGLMDEDYFLYFEETDFCLQARRKGWLCSYVPSSCVLHYVGQSTGIVAGDIQRSRRPRYWFESRQRYFVKNHGVLYTMLADLIWGIGFSLWRLRRFIQSKPDTDPEKMLFDFWRNSIFFNKIGRR